MLSTGGSKPTDLDKSSSTQGLGALSMKFSASHLKLYVEIWKLAHKVPSHRQSIVEVQDSVHSLHQQRQLKALDRAPSSNNPQTSGNHCLTFLSLLAFTTAQERVGTTPRGHLPAKHRDLSRDASIVPVLSNDQRRGKGRWQDAREQVWAWATGNSPSCCHRTASNSQEQDTFIVRPSRGSIGSIETKACCVRHGPQRVEGIKTTKFKK